MHMKKWLLVLFANLVLSAAAFATINVNTANQKELEVVKGIGPAKAKAILDYRTKHGPFKSVDELDKVKGIGKKTLDEIRPQVAVSGPNTPPAAPSKAHPRARTQSKAKTVPNPMAPSRAAH
jgi:competence protein ComEA